MPESIILCSPPRLQHLDIGTEESDIENIIPEIRQLAQGPIASSLVWRGRIVDSEFVLDKGLRISVNWSHDEVDVYARALAMTGLTGDIIIYILSRDSDTPVVTMLALDNTPDDTMLSQIVYLLGTAIVDGFYVEITSTPEGRLFRIVSHFHLVPPKTVIARASLVYSKMAELGMDTRLLLTDLHSKVYTVAGELLEEEFVEEPRDQEERAYAANSVDELIHNLERGENA